MGGAMSMQYASEHPDDVAGMVFVDAAYKELYESYLDEVPSFEGRLRWGKLAMRAAAVSAVFGLPRLIPFHAGNEKMPADARGAADAFAVRPRFLNAMRAEMEGLEASRTTALSNPPRDIPVAVLSHSEPKLFPKDPKAEGLWLPLQRKLADRFEDATFQRVEGAGHFIQLDRPDAVVSAIERVLDSAAERNTG
jgi:pimeloyl-ACP methyl ester carboxylesterase